MTIYLYLIAGLIIFALSTVAINLHWRLHKVRKQNKLRKIEEEKQYEAGRDHLNQSIQIICKALLEHQVGYAEASLRISKLMDQLAVPADVRQEYVAFDKLAEAISHIPILDAWRNLSRQQRREYTQQIEQHEEDLGDFVKDAAQRMLGRRF